jgi:hypothetical protein
MALKLDAPVGRIFDLVFQLLKIAPQLTLR